MRQKIGNSVDLSMAVDNLSIEPHAHSFRTGARWLIAEHRRCIGELKRIKGMIADLAKYIATLSGKGRALQI